MSEGGLEPKRAIDSLTSEYARKPMIKRGSAVLDVPHDSLTLLPLGLEAQRLSRSVSGPPVRLGRFEQLTADAVTTCLAALPPRRSRQ